MVASFKISLRINRIKKNQNDWLEKKITKGHNLLWLIIFIELEIRYRTQTEKSPFYTLEDFLGSKRQFFQ